ncbi:hypothetical protein U1Q18_050674, partial [Sarracenia purpurea var. burkii]
FHGSSAETCSNTIQNETIEKPGRKVVEQKKKIKARKRRFVEEAMPILKDEGALQEYEKKGIQMIENVEVQWKQVTYVDVELRVFD